MTNRLISVCIASIGRASLRETVAGASACALPAGFALEIIVADDSLDGVASALLAGISVNQRSGDATRNDTPPTVLHIVTSAAKNISVARNACLERARGDYLVFIDDDEVPARDWLTCLVEHAEISGADAVQGNVTGIYPENAPAWVAGLRPFDKNYGEAGKRIAVGSTCNLLVRRRSLTIHALHFSTVFGKSGGEDTDLCYRMTEGGGVIVCSPAAMVYEKVPQERLSRHHLMRRYARGGHTFANVVLARRGHAQRALEFAKACALSAGFLLLAALSAPLLPALSMRYTLRLSGNLGKISYFLGQRAWNLY